MVLAELGSKISKALHTMTNSVVIDEAVLDSMIKTISMALLQADVDVKLVKQMQTNIKSKVNLEDVAAGSNKRKLIQTVVIKELFALLNPGVKAFEPKKGQPNVIMFVGLQGAGKTTTCTKYAYYWKRKGWKTALVCADTFRAGAYDQLKQNALKAKIPFYGSYTEQDPASVAEAGVEQFRKEKYDIIVVDTSGRHKQESALFLEMQEVAKATQPDDIVFVMDSSIGQAARDQAEAFKGAVPVGSVIITKLDGHAKGGGALSAVAATKSPICFVGTGEHMDEFEPFDTRSFVQRLLGMGDIGGLMKMFEEKEMFEQQGKRMQEIMEGNGEFTYRDMRDQFENLLKLGPLNKVMDMIPGFAGLMGKGKEQESVARIKRFMTIMDSMTQQELDSDGKMFSTQPNRLNRIARGAGVSVRHVQEVIETFKPFKKVAANMAKLGPKGLDPKAIMQPGRGGQMNMRKIAGMFNPQMLQKMGGIGNLQNMMKKFSQAMPGGMPGGKGGFGDLSGMGFPPGMMDDQ